MCPHWHRFRVYLDVPDTHSAALRNQEWQKRTGESLPCYDTLHAMGLAIHEFCQDKAASYLEEYVQFLSRGLFQFLKTNTVITSHLQDFEIMVSMATYQLEHLNISDPVAQQVSSLLHSTERVALNPIQCHPGKAFFCFLVLLQNLFSPLPLWLRLLIRLIRLSSRCPMTARPCHLP